MRHARLLSTLAATSALTLTAALVASTAPAFADNPLAPRTTFNMVVNPADGTVGAGDRRGGDPQHRLGEVDHPRLLQRHGRRREQDQLALHEPGPRDREPDPVHPAGHGSCQRGACLRRRRHAAVELRLRGQGHQLQLRPHDQRDLGHPASLREVPECPGCSGSSGPAATTSTASPVVRRHRRPTRSRTSTSRAYGQPASRREHRCSQRPPCTPRTRSWPVRPRRSRPSRGSTALPTGTRPPAPRLVTRRLRATTSRLPTASTS